MLPVLLYPGSQLAEQPAAFTAPLQSHWPALGSQLDDGGCRQGAVPEGRRAAAAAEQGALDKKRTLILRHHVTSRHRETNAWLEAGDK
jgi:hypothetical protein